MSREANTSKGAHLKLNNSNNSNNSTVILPLLTQRQDAARAQVSLTEYNYTTILGELGYDGVINAAWEESKAARPQHPFFTDPSADTTRLYHWLDECMLLLADIPQSILESLLDGTLAQKVCKPAAEHGDVFQHFDESRLIQWINSVNGIRPEVSHWVTRMQKPYCPALYVRVFVNRSGESPTLAQLRNVLDHLERYMSGKPQDRAVCAEIDNQYRDQSTEDDIANGFHAHFQGLETRVEGLLAFTTALRKVLDSYGPAGSHLDNIPFSGTFKYFGFTANYADRQKAHDRRRTSWLMALFDSVCRMLFRDPNNVPLFDFRQFVVAYPISKIECQLGEELLCRMGSSYYYTGLGFNIQHAGLSVHSSSLAELMHLNADDMWGACKTARYSCPIADTQFQYNFTTFFEKYMQKCRDVNSSAEYDKLVQEGARLEARLEEIRQRDIPWSAFEAHFKKVQDKWKELEDTYGPEEAQEKAEIQALAKAALDQLAAQGKAAWSRPLPR